MKNILKMELIGVGIEVTDSRNKSEKGIEGTIIDETKNIFTIETSKGIKKVTKENITILLKEKGLKIRGDLLVGRPEDRIKKKK